MIDTWIEFLTAFTQFQLKTNRKQVKKSETVSPKDLIKRFEPSLTSLISPRKKVTVKQYFNNKNVNNHNLGSESTDPTVWWKYAISTEVWFVRWARVSRYPPRKKTATKILPKLILVYTLNYWESFQRVSSLQISLLKFRCHFLAHNRNLKLITTTTAVKTSVEK